MLFSRTVFNMKSGAFLLCLYLGYAFGNPFSDEGACDPATRPRVIESSNVMVWTPNFRESTYPPNTICEWLIRAPDGLDSGVEVRFGDFDVQTCNNCGCDYVEAFDGGDDSAASLGRKCGAATVPFFSFGNELFLRFESNDDGIEGDGFNAQMIHTTVAPRECFLEYDPVVFTDTTGVVRSPGYPEPYLPNLNCRWVISTPGAVGYKLIFDEPFTTEACCTCDYLQLNSGTSLDDLRIGLWFGQDAPYHVGSLGPDLFVNFASDASTEWQGFQFTYEALYDEAELADWTNFSQRGYGPRFI